MSAKTSFFLILMLAALIAFASASWAQVGPKGPHPLVSSPSTVEKFTKLAINGNGATNFSSTNCVAAGLVCASGDSCECVETTGNYKGNIVGSGAFDFIVSLDLTAGGTPQGSGLSSYLAAGFITLTSGSNSLVIETNGIIADAPKFDFAQYTGSYGVSSGTGKFATTIGTGTVAWNGAVTAVSGDTQLSLVGNIDLKP